MHPSPLPAMGRAGRGGLVVQERGLQGVFQRVYPRCRETFIPELPPPTFFPLPYPLPVGIPFRSARPSHAARANSTSTSLHPAGPRLALF